MCKIKNLCLINQLKTKLSDKENHFVNLDLKDNEKIVNLSEEIISLKRVINILESE